MLMKKLFRSWSEPLALEKQKPESACFSGKASDYSLPTVLVFSSLPQAHMLFFFSTTKEVQRERESEKTSKWEGILVKENTE
ncbi:Uncharacterized protein DAT39_000200, partial [Clarias magur]